MSGGKLSIRPASNSRRFDKIKDQTTGVMVASILDYTIEAKDKQGQTRSIPGGEFIHQRFPDSKQGNRAYYDEKKKIFLIKKEDGTYYTQDDINEVVKNVSVRYNIKGEANYNQRIERSDIKDFDDPFINHIDFVIRFDEGGAVVDMDTAVGKFQADILRGMPHVMDENVDNRRSLNTEYVIHHPEMQEEREVKAMEDELQAIELYQATASDPKKMLAILRIMGKDWGKDADTKTLRLQTYKMAQDNVGGERGVSNQKAFIQYALLPDDQRDVRELVAMAMMYNEIVYKGGIYMLDGMGIGSTYDALVDFFSKGENGRYVDVLKIKLEGKL